MILTPLIQYGIEMMFCTLIFTTIGVIAMKLIVERRNVRCKCSARLDGKTVLITGGSSGIGLETARDLAKRGARVIITCIKEETARTAAENLIATTGNKDIHYRQFELASFDNIERLAKDINANFDKLHILVNNAGTACHGYSVTENEIEMTMQVNYVGPALLTLLLLPKLKASRPSRIVVLSSNATKTGEVTLEHIRNNESRSQWQRYACSKLNGLLWVKALSRRLPEGITVNAVHPGFVQTNIFVEPNHYFNQIFLFLVGKLFKTAEEGAQTSVHCCVSPELEGVTGEYLTECQVAKSVPAFDDYDITEKVWDATLRLIDSRLTDETRIK